MVYYIKIRSNQNTDVVSNFLALVSFIPHNQFDFVSCHESPLSNFLAGFARDPIVAAEKGKQLDVSGNTDEENMTPVEPHLIYDCSWVFSSKEPVYF